MRIDKRIIMLFLFSSAFFVKGNPVLYNVYSDSFKTRFYFKPGNYPTRTPSPPSFFISWKTNKWMFNGIENKELKEQAIHNIRFCNDIESYVVH